MAASGFGLADFDEFPELAARMFESAGMRKTRAPACDGPVKYKNLGEVQTDIANLKAALSGVDVRGAFMSAASPGVISGFLPNHYYKTPEAYLADLADAMKTEYEAIHASGLTLQLDCPDLAMSRHIWFTKMSPADFRKRISLHVEALNHATASIPPENMRMHLCWGNYEGPHHCDVPLTDVIDIVLKARPATISLEAANPRHEHEWQVFETVKLPEGKTLIPGMLDSTTNFVEHPQLIAQRLLRWASVVGKEHLMAGTDCGFATFAGLTPVYPGIVWLKFKAMAEGCRIASEKLWG
jgi:5-methyltetrahydropteroyltriglutamate--homocysteine methyltransferase